MKKQLSFSEVQNLNESRFRVAIYALSVLLLLISFYFRPLVLILLVIQVAYVMLADEKDSVLLLFFMLSFASVYKIAPGTMSFYTIIELFLTVWILLRRQRLGAWTIIGCMALFAVILFAPSHDFVDAARVILALVIFCVLSSNESYDVRSIVVVFALGLLVSSVIAMLRGVLPNLTHYIAEVENYTSVGTSSRFSGLYSDPNYYSVNIMTCNFALLSLYARRRIGNIFWPIMVSLCVFGMLTMSKSLILMLVLFLLVMVATLATGRNRIMAIIAVVVIGIFAVYFLYSKDSFFTVLRARFVFDSVDVLTTGRTNILKRYLTFLISDSRALLLGRGLGAELLFIRGRYRASHNLYVDLVYYFGLIGTTVFALTIGRNWIEGRRRMKRSLHHYFTILCVLCMYFFLSAVMMVELPFLFLIGFYIYNDSDIPAYGTDRIP